jgi:hypothetical protein
MNLIKQIKDIALARKEWWGYNKDHDWVVLLWDFPAANANAKRTENTFYSFAKKGFVKIALGEWGPPRFIFAPIYVSGLKQGAELDSALRELEYLFKNSRLLRSSLEERERADYTRQGLVLLKKHRTYLSKVRPNEPYLGARPPETPNSQYENHCHGCVTSIFGGNYRCVRCNWVVCQNCGACGCGWSRPDYSREALPAKDQAVSVLYSTSKSAGSSPEPSYL